MGYNRHRARQVSCTSKTNKHKTRSGALRCPVHRQAANRADLPPQIVSAVPQRGAVHQESRLPFCTGTKVQSGHHNVGQEMTIPATMNDAVWRKTWFEKVTFVPDDKTGSNTLSLTNTASPARPSHDSIFIRDCKALSWTSFDLGGVSRIEDVEGSFHSRQSITARDDTRVVNATGFDRVVASNSASVTNSHARAMAVSGFASAEGCTASDWFIAGGNAKIVMTHPGQCVLTESDFKGTIESDFPVLVYRGTFTGNQVGANKLRARIALMRRNPDGSEGSYLHPRNESAWEALENMGGLAVSDEGFGRDKTVTVDEDILAIALKLHENPADGASHE